jgi:hypothetical protein
VTTPPRGFSRLRVLLRLPGIPFHRRLSPVVALASIGLLAFATPAYGASQENILNGVSCTNTTFCIAVGSFGGGVVDRGSLAEEWNGTSWSMLPTPNPAHGSPSALGGVSCIASNACIAVGGSATTSPLFESWDGSSWSIESAPSPGAGADLSSVSCTSALFCMAVGSSEGSPISEEWNGTTWNVVTVPVPTGADGASLYSVSCLTEAFCMAAGSSNGTLAEYWNGTTWTVETTPNPTNSTLGYLTDVSCSGSDSCVAMDGNSSVTWNGANWTSENVATPSGGQAYLGGVSCQPSISPPSCIATGSDIETSGRYSTLAESLSNGAWSIVSTPTSPRARLSLLGGLACPLAGSCVTTGYQQTSGGTAKGLTEVSSGGEWSIEKPASIEPLSLAPSSGAPKQPIAVTGFGFPPESPVKVSYATGIRSPSVVTLCTVTAASNGAFSCAANVPPGRSAGSRGSHKVIVRGSGLSWSTSFDLS